MKHYFIFPILFLSMLSGFSQTRPGDLSKDVKHIDADALLPFNGGAAVIKIGYTSALIDANGQVLVPFKKFNFQTYSVSSNYSSPGIGGSSGDMITPETSGLFRTNAANPAGAFAVVNAKGQTVYTPVNNMESDNAYGPGYFVVATNRKVINGAVTDDYTYITAKGILTVIKAPLEVPTLSEGVMTFRQRGTGRWGFMDTKGQVIIPPQYTLVHPFSEGLAAVCKLDSYNQAKWGFIDTKGKEVIPFIYTNEPGSFSNGLALVTPTSAADFKCAFIDKKGEVVIKVPANAHFDTYSKPSFHNGYLFSGGAVLDSTGKIYTNNEWCKAVGLPDSSVVQPLYFSGDQLFFVKDNASTPPTVGIYDFRTKTFTPPVFTSLSLFDRTSGLAYAKFSLGKDPKTSKEIFREGYIDHEGVFNIVVNTKTAIW